RTDGRGVTTNYGYDALNRLTGKTYSDGVTSAVTFSWDPAIANGFGRLGAVANGSGVMNYTGYDAMGRVTQSNQQTPSYYYNFSYSYDLTEALTSETYPPGPNQGQALRAPMAALIRAPATWPDNQSRR